MKIKEEMKDGKFIIDEKMQDVVQDLLFVLEKWQCRTLEKQIALQQATQYIDQIRMNKINESRSLEANGFMKQWMKKIGFDDEN